METVSSANNFYFGENKSMKDIASSASNISKVLQCFVCDAQVEGRHYSLVSCRTQGTRTRVIEKLGELVGERYMVVISEDDVICRSCANLINTLDRLETEIKSVSGTVLRYLERKYCLEDGELRNDKETDKTTQSSLGSEVRESDKKKRPSELPDNTISKKKKKPILLQCDKCRYTTNYNTFMVHHIRQHVNQKINCDKCGVQFMGNSQQNNSHNCNEKQKPVENDPESFIDTKDESSENTPIQDSLPIVATKDHEIFYKEEVNAKIIHTSNFDNLHENVENSEIILNQESLADDSETVLVEGTNSTTDALQKKDFSAKQILTVREDGSLEMMEVETWAEKNAILKENEL